MKDETKILLFAIGGFVVLNLLKNKAFAQKPTLPIGTGTVLRPAPKPWEPGWRPY